MRDYAVIGAGHVGREISHFLSTRGTCALIDPNRSALDMSLSVEKIKGTIASNPEILTESRIFVVALPGSIARDVVERLLKEEKRVVDVSFYEDNPFIFENSVSGNSVYVPDCGFAPGLSNIMVGYLSSRFGSRRIGVYVGGLPRQPKKPFMHSITWSAEGFIDEYTRPARIIRNGAVVELDPLEEKFNYRPKGFGTLEGFYSDGLRTLLNSLSVKELFEITLRYEGHLEKMKFLRDMGFFNDDGICSAKSVTEMIFSQYGDHKDVSILDVVDLDNPSHKIELRDYGRENVTSMARLTGHTAALTAVMLNENPDIKGFLPPEEFGKDDDRMNYIFNGLRNEGVEIDIS